MRETTAERYARRVVLSLLTLFVLVPLFAMVSSAVKPLRDVQGTFTWLPTHPTVAAFVDMWTTVPLARYLMNSLVVSTCAAIISVTVAIFAAFAVSRYRFRGRTLFSVTVLSTQMFPGILFLLPLFLIYVNLGNATGIQLYASRAGLIITYLTFSLPFSIWMLVGYLGAIPRGLDEAAQVDGAGAFRLFWSIVLPMSRPIIGVVSVFAVIATWKDYLWPLLVLRNPDLQPLSVRLPTLQPTTELDIFIAALTISSVIPIALFLLFQRMFLQGAGLSGALKG